MTAAEVLAGLPDDARVSVIVGQGDMTIGQLRVAMSTATAVYITTSEAARRYSRSPEWWAAAAAAGHVPGAWKDRVWRLPVQGCEEHLAALIRPRRHVPKPSPSTRVRPQGLVPR